MTSQKFPIASSGKNPVPLWQIASGELEKYKNQIGRDAYQWAKAANFNGSAGALCLVSGSDHKLKSVLVGSGIHASPLDTGRLPSLLPAGLYQLENPGKDPDLASLGFVLGAYRFTKYTGSKNNKEIKGGKVRLLLPNSVDRKFLEAQAEAHYLTRDMINTPTNDMGPDDLESAFRALAKRFKARARVTKGTELLNRNFPMIHAVGRASEKAPRLLDMSWGNKKNPKVTLVGKGVCFDTGGLNLKSGNSMTLMKKDMGGAANVLGLALIIMAMNLPVRLRVLIPAVENSVAGNAFRPGDVLTARNGTTVEIGNTDAEGRLVLADALVLASEENPDLIVDMATLTGAARVALGPDLPPFYSNVNEIADRLGKISHQIADPLWHMPLWQPYIAMLRSKIADTNNITGGGFAGSVTAALFLQKFVKPDTLWMHFDVFGWVPSAKPWAPVGGEAQGIRALYKFFEERYRGK